MNEQEILRLGMEAYDREDYILAFPYLLKAAEAGDREAQFRCGDLYQDEEKSGEFNAEKAMYWYEKAAKQGHAEAQCRYGLAYDIGWGEDEITDEKEAFYWYGKAAKQGHAEAQYYYGGMYENGNGTDENLEKALYWYEKAAKQGNTDAMCQIAFIYEVEMEPTDPKKALHWYDMAAAGENNEAMISYNLLRDRLDMSGSEPLEKEKTISQWEEYKIKRGDAEVIGQWEDKSRQGDAEAAYLCALAYRYAYSAEDLKAKAMKSIGTKASRARSLELCNRRIGELSEMQQKNGNILEFTNGVAGVLFMIAQIYYEDGDKKSALHWFLRSYNLDSNTNTARRCAKMYYEGDGIKKDYQTAYKLYFTMAESNIYDQNATYQCGIMQFFGEGVPASPEQAFQYFSRLLDRGDSMGRYLCAAMYYKGIGISQDTEKASELIEGFPDETFESKQEIWIQECIKRGYYTWGRLKIEHYTVYV